MTSHRSTRNPGAYPQEGRQIVIGAPPQSPLRANKATRVQQPHQGDVPAPKQPKPKRPPRVRKPLWNKMQLPPNTIPPKDWSWQKLHWFFNWLLLRRDKTNPGYWKVPKPGHKEQAKLDKVAKWKALWYNLAFNITYLRRLRSLPGLIVDIAVYNPKGQSGKSARALAIGNCSSWFGGASMLILPVTLQTSQGDLGTMSGIPGPSHVPVSSVYDNRKNIKSVRDLTSLIPRTAWNAYVVGEDEPKGPQTSPTMTPDQQYELIESLQPHVPGGMVFDMANEGPAPDGFVYNILNRATVCVIPTMADSPPSRKKLRQCIRDIAAAPEEFQGTDPAHKVSLKRKLDDAIVIVGAVKPGETIDFEALLYGNATDETSPGEAEEERRFETTHTFRGARLTTPYEPTLHPENGDDDVVYHLFRIDHETLLADLRLTVECYERGAKILGIDAGKIKYNLEPDFEIASVLLGTDVTWLADYQPTKETFSR